MAACGGDNLADLRDYAREVTSRPAAAIQPLPKIRQVDAFVFDPQGRRDPFAMEDRRPDVWQIAPPPSGIAPDPLRRKEELEQYPLDSLRMLGTLQQGDSIWGLVISPDGTLHRVRVGNYMGLNNGQITRVSEEEIEITEIVSDGANDWRERRAAIALSQ
jgi:type IV pilus assembly protein PilP